MARGDRVRAPPCPQPDIPGCWRAPRRAPSLPGIELRRSQVKIVGQKRSRAGQGKRRAGHFPRSATKQRLESGLGLIVGQPRRNAPFLTHDHRCIPYGGIPGGTRRELNGQDFSLARRPVTKGTFISRGRGTGPPSRRCRIVAPDGTCNDPLSLSRTTGCRVCPGCGHPGARLVSRHRTCAGRGA